MTILGFVARSVMAAWLASARSVVTVVLIFGVVGGWSMGQGATLAARGHAWGWMQLVIGATAAGIAWVGAAELRRGQAALTGILLDLDAEDES